MIEEYFRKRFGIPKNIFSRYWILEKKKKYWIASEDVKRADLRGLRIEAIGMLLARKNREIKPTTDAVQVFGRFAKKNRIELNEKQFHDLLRGLDIQVKAKAEDGYVILFFKQAPVAVGLYRQGRLKNVIPKARRLKL